MLVAALYASRRNFIRFTFDDGIRQCSVGGNRLSRSSTWLRGSRGRFFVLALVVGLIRIEISYLFGKLIIFEIKLF